MNHLNRSAAEGPQLRTLLLTDLVDSTGLVERLGDVQAAALFRQHDRLVLELQQQWRGRLIDRSDGLLLLFERPVDGLGFALDYTRGLQAIGQERGVELQARAGLHVGEVLTWKNSDAAVQVGAKPLEVEGLAKPMAARLMSLARPGQILLSAVAESLTHRAARDLGERGQNLLWKSHGRWRFKGVPEAQEIFEVGEVGIAPLRAPGNIAKAWRDTPLWRRPAMLAAEVLLVAGLGIGAWFVTKPQPAIAFSERDWVVVGDLRNLTGQKVMDDSLAQAFRISLEQSRYVNVLSEMKARDTLARMQRKPGTLLDRAIASEIAIRDGARAVILPTVSEVGGRVRFSAEVVDPHTQTTVHAESADGNGAGSALESIDKVTAALRGRLGEALASIEQDSAPLPQVTTANLDALRAYALGLKATANRNWDESVRLYQRAVQIDPDFALAYMGLVRSYWSTTDYAAALPYLDKALALRESLPPRDNLYLDAWKAETDPKNSPLEQWRLLASMYPDYFAGASNASWYLMVENRYAEALPYATAAAVPQDPFRAFPLDHLGRIHLAMGKPALALEQFLLSEKEGGGSPIRYRADALAVLGRYAEAQQVLDSLKPDGTSPASLYSRIEQISLALDQGQFAQAREKAQQSIEIAQAADARVLRKFQVMQQLVAVVDDPRSVSLDALQQLATAEQIELLQALPHGRIESLMNLLAIALVAQRSNHADFSGKVINAALPLVDELGNPNLGKMMRLLQAQQLNYQGQVDEAIAALNKQVDGNELFQVHSALVAAYQAAGKHELALRHTQWLQQNRGRAYVEYNLDQLLQPLNVADTRLAHLWASQSNAALGRSEAAAQQQAAFLKAWPEARP